MYFEEDCHRHDHVGSQVARTIVITCLEMCICEIEDVPQVILDLSDKIPREFYGVSIAIRFVDGETVGVRSLYDTYDFGGGEDISAYLYRVRRSWSST